MGTQREDREGEGRGKMKAEILEAIQDYKDGLQRRFVSNAESWHVKHLKPCPKCGGQDLSLCSEEWPGATMGTWVSCMECNYIGPIVSCQSVKSPTSQATAAMEAWDAVAEYVVDIG